MNKISLIAGGYNVVPLVAAYKRQPDLWNLRAHRRTNPQTPHRDVDDIWLRYNAWENRNDADPFSFGEEHESVWYPEFRALPQAARLVFRLMNLVEGERLGGVFITKVPPGKQVFPHEDRGWHVDHYDKYGIQLEGGPNQSFCFEGESLVTHPGDVFYFDNRHKHWVINDSEFDRVTMLVAIRSDRYRGT
jgi:hypothetical protein